MYPSPGKCEECGESVLGQWRISKSGRIKSRYGRTQRHIECWVKSKNVQHISIPRNLSRFHLQWGQRYRMTQKDGARLVTKQNAWLELEDMKRITKLLFPNLIMPQSQRYEMGIADINKMTVKQLQRELWSRNVPAHGKKQQLKQTLRDYMNGDKCLTVPCSCQFGDEYSNYTDLQLCYRLQRYKARRKRSEYISFGFCRRMEKRHIPNEVTRDGCQEVAKTLRIPSVLKQIIFKYYDMIMY